MYRLHMNMLKLIFYSVNMKVEISGTLSKFYYIVPKQNKQTKHLFLIEKSNFFLLKVFQEAITNFHAYTALFFFFKI